MAVRKIGIASDHAGYDYRLEIKKFLASEGYEVTDFGVEEKKAVSGWKIRLLGRQRCRAANPRHLRRRVADHRGEF